MAALLGDEWSFWVIGGDGVWGGGGGGGWVVL